LSYRYNALKTLRYCHKEMWRDEDVKNVHLILKKPWYNRLPEGDQDYETHKWYVLSSFYSLSLSLEVRLLIRESIIRWWDAFEEMEQQWGDTPGWELIESTVNREVKKP